MSGQTSLGEAVRFDLNSEETNEMLLKPLFVSDSVLGSSKFKIMRNVKRSATMYFAGAMEGVVQANKGCGWNPQGAMPLTQRDIEVAKHCVQLELCTDEFWDTCFEYLTGQGIDIYQLDDTDAGRKVLEFLLLRVGQAVTNDVFKLSFFGDTASALPFYAQADGWNKQIEADIAAGLTPPTVVTGSGAPLAAGASVTIFEDMMNAQTDELDDLEANQKSFMVSKSIWNNYRDYLKNAPNIEGAWIALQDGMFELRFCGIPVIKCPQFDKVETALGNPDTHRAYLVYTQTLTVATDVNGAESSFVVRFDEKTKFHEIESYFRLGFSVAHPELVVYAK